MAHIISPKSIQNPQNWYLTPSILLWELLVIITSPIPLLTHPSVSPVTLSETLSCLNSISCHILWLRLCDFFLSLILWGHSLSKVFRSPLCCWLISLRGMFEFLVPFSDKVFIQASGLACEVCVEVSPLRSLPTTVCEVKVCLLFLILCYWVCVIVNLLYFLSTTVYGIVDSIG